MSYRGSIKFPYFADNTERGDRTVKAARRDGEDRVTWEIIRNMYG